uniref:P94-like protein n=1 Tax=Glyptapanteles indiensis TaxID=92994 RepID=B7S8V3_GLYIN|nr:conserved hypothetical protein [Glyptapanteles indiensis]
MVNYFVYAKDFSASTYGVEHYHSNGLKTLEEFKKDVEEIKEELLNAGEPPTESKIVYLHWNNCCYEVDEDEIERTYVEMQSEWLHREPKSFIRFLKNEYIVAANDKIKLLYIITDGAISNESAEKCLELNEGMHYETVVFHAFNEKTEKIDLSVAASFFKSRCIVYRNYELCDMTDISKEFDYDKINGDNFAAEKGQLISYIKLKFIDKFKRGIVSGQELQNLRNLRDRLAKELSLKTPPCPFFDSDFDPKKRRLAMLTFNPKRYTKLFVAVFEMKQEAETFVGTLMRYLRDIERSYSFDALKIDTEVDQYLKTKQIDNDYTYDLDEIEVEDLVLKNGEPIPDLSAYIANCR